MKINREKALAAFQEYTDRYDSSRDMIRLKIEHTYRVCGLCQQIARSLELPEEEVDIAWLTGLLHDVGRFEQQRYMEPSPMRIPSIMRNTEQGFYLVRSGKRNTDLLPEVKKACPRKFRQTLGSVSGISWKMLPAMSFCGRRCFITALTGFRKNWTNVQQCSAISYGMRIRLIF